MDEVITKYHGYHRVSWRNVHTPKHWGYAHQAYWDAQNISGFLWSVLYPDAFVYRTADNSFRIISPLDIKLEPISIHKSHRPHTTPIKKNDKIVVEHSDGTKEYGHFLWRDEEEITCFMYSDKDTRKFSRDCLESVNQGLNNYYEQAEHN